MGSDNLAKKSGGAIAVQGNAKLVVAVLQSVFDSNAVTPPSDVAAVDLTVRLNTVRVMGNRLSYGVESHGHINGPRIRRWRDGV